MVSASDVLAYAAGPDLGLLALRSGFDLHCFAGGETKNESHSFCWSDGLNEGHFVPLVQNRLSVSTIVKAPEDLKVPF